MIQRISKVIPLWLWVGLLVAASPALARQADVVEELKIRAVARSLMAEPDRPLGSPAEAGDWRQAVALLEAYARAGAPAPAALVAADPADRVELVAAKLRVLPWTLASAEDFELRLSRGLRSSFGAERWAALERLAAWTLEESAVDGRASRLLEQELLAGEAPEAGRLFRLALRSGGGRRFDSLLSLPVAAEELEQADRGGWDPVLGFFEDIVALPLSLEEVGALEDATVEAGALACVQLVAHVRDQLSVAAPEPAAVVAVIAQSSDDLESGELDAVAEALVQALASGSNRRPVHRIVLKLGESLLAEADRTGLDADARERCLRTAARLLPVAEVLVLGERLDEEAALVLWDTLGRRDDWPRGARLIGGLAPWIGHASVSVREAAVRAVGRRYAYAGRSDLEGTLVEALRDLDATIRSLTFAWLAKSERPESEGTGAATEPLSLDLQLFAAWEREGHGGESFALTERQGRWLAQLPRDRTATLYRSALLGLLSLEGDAKEVVGAGSVELLAGFAGDAEVFQRVAILLERSLVGIETRAGYPARLPFDSSAARAVRILYAVDRELAEPLIEEALLRSMERLHGPDARGDARPQLPKTAVALLARSPSGRDRLAVIFVHRLPRRVRFEMALQFLKRGAGESPAAAKAVAARSAEVLMGDFDAVDSALRLRAIGALGSPPLRDREGIDDFLAELTGVGSDEAERGAAIEALGRRGSLAELDSVLDAALEGVGPDAGTIDAAANAARALRLCRDRSVEAARMALGRLAGLDLVRAEERQLGTVRGTLIESLAVLLVEHGGSSREGADWLGEEEVGALLAAVLQAPLQVARTGGSRQFRSGRRVETAFLWASELAALKTLGGAPALFRRALGSESRWGHLDGRTLLSIARVAHAAGVRDLGRDLAAGAAVALGGEGPAPDLQRRLAEARWLHGTLAVDAGNYASGAGSFRVLLASYREGTLPRGVLRAMLPGIERPRVVLHQRYWDSRAHGRPGHGAGVRAAAWLRLL